MVVSKVAIWLVVTVMAKPAGRDGRPPSQVGALHSGRSPAAHRRAERLGEDMFRYGVSIGSEHAREGLDYSRDMGKDPNLIPFYTGSGPIVGPLATTSRELTKRMAAAPPHLRATYYKAFAAGYELGQQLNLPKERLTGLLSLDRLVRIGSALISYVVEGDRKIPRMASIASLRRALVPLMGVRAADFVNPYTNRPYGLNSSLSGKELGDLASHAPHTVFAFEATPAPDGTRGVLFVNGGVRRVSEREWEPLKKDSGIG